MSGIRSTGRRGFTVVPNWRWEDPALDCYTLRVAGWIASHADSYRDEYVTRNEIARKIGQSRERTSTSLALLESLGIVSLERVHDDATASRFVITFNFTAWEGEDAGRPRGGRQASSTEDATRPPYREEQSPEEQGEQHGVRPPGHYDDPDFVTFWSLYPNKTGKPRAWKAWRLARKTASARMIIGGLERWIDFWEAGRTEQRFIPHPATWLNDARYDDVPPRPGKQSKSMDTLGRLARGELG